MLAQETVTKRCPFIGDECLEKECALWVERRTPVADKKMLGMCAIAAIPKSLDRMQEQSLKSLIPVQRAE